MSFNYLIVNLRGTADDHISQYARPGDRVLLEEYSGAVAVRSGVNIQGWEDPRTQLLLERAIEIDELVEKFFDDVEVNSLPRAELVSWITANIPELREEDIPDARSWQVLELSREIVIKQLHQQALFRNLDALCRFAMERTLGRTFIVLSKNLAAVCEDPETAREFGEFIQKHRIVIIKT